jgi:NAD(P)H-dependent FMN reductase
MRLLAISGSLRAASSNTAVLKAASRLAPAGVDIVFYAGLGDLPPFNPDLDTEVPPPAVAELRRAVGASEGLVISSPEYAHGIAGSLKNVLDWLVSSLEFPEKPVAILSTSPRAVHADAQLREILKTMSARLVEAASIALPLLGRGLDADGIAADTELAPMLARAVAEFVAAIGSSSRH